MATPPEQPWHNHEKNYLLAEILKTANPPANVLFSVIQNLQVQPRWDETPLPPGRSLLSCRNAFDEMRRNLSVPMAAPAGPLAPSPLSGPMPTLKRPYQYDASFAGASSGREIRPKPSMASASHSQPSPTDPPAKKKRGRPTKAEALAKAEAAAATIAPYNEPGPMSVSRPVSQSTPQPHVPQSRPPSVVGPLTRLDEPGVGPPPPTLPPVTRMPIAAMLTPTARDPENGDQPHSGSSAGRRRRARSTKSEPGESPHRHTTQVGHGYESPYGHSDAPDTPARAAVLRHRDDQTSATKGASGRRATEEHPDRPPSHESERT